MSLNFLRGLLATVNPCGFILLPTYLMYFLGMQGSRPGTQRASIRRALLVGGAVSAGFMAVFVVVGIISYNTTSWIIQNAKYATLAIGLGLIVLGIALLLGWKLPFATPKVDVGQRDTTVWSMFVYGIAYAVASIGCTIGLFLPAIISTSRDGLVEGVGNVVAYGMGMALVVVALTVSLAVANTGLLKVLRSGMQYVDRIAAAFVILSGLYLVYYFWVVDVNGESDPITQRVDSFQVWVLDKLDGNWQAVALVLGGIVVAAIAYVVIRRDDTPGAGAVEPAQPPIAAPDEIATTAATPAPADELG